MRNSGIENSSEILSQTMYFKIENRLNNVKKNHVEVIQF